MRSRIKRGRANHTTVVAYLALFIAIGGGAAYAAGHLAKNSVGAKQLKKNAVTSPKLKNGAVTAAKLKSGAVTAAKLAGGAVGTAALQDKAVSTAKIADNAVGGAQADEASFQGLIHGNGTQFSTTVQAPAKGLIEPPDVLAEIPGFGKIQFFFCGAFGDEDKVDIQAVSFENAADFISVGSVHAMALPAGTGKVVFSQLGGGHLSGGGGEFLQGKPNAGAEIGLFGTTNKFDWTFFRGSGPNATTAHVSISALDDSNTTTHEGNCFVSAETIIEP